MERYSTSWFHGLGARVSKQSGPTQFHYMRDGADVLSPILHDGASGYSPGVGMKTGTTVRAFASDRLGTHTNEVSSSGVTATRESDAFGNLLNPPRQGASPYGYAGVWGYTEDDESGFKHVGFRECDPVGGRFLTSDPIHSGHNWFWYGGNSPVGAVDPLGLDNLLIVFGALGGGDGGDPDISGYAKDIADDIAKEHPGDTVIIVHSADEAKQYAAWADKLYFIGHTDDGRLFTDDGELTAEEFSDARGGKRMKLVHLIGCNTLSNPGRAAAWARVGDGNTWGTYGSFPINLYARGIPGIHLTQCKKNRKPFRWIFGWGSKGKKHKKSRVPH